MFRIVIGTLIYHSSKLIDLEYESKLNGSNDDV
jgi:hypothetical protein